LGASRETPVVSCGEENLLGLEGDPYAGENILIHEFAHGVHALGMGWSPEFDSRLKAAYEQAMKAGLWQGAYAAANAEEYWAEGAQSWFHSNARPNEQHIDVQTRAQIKEYDPQLAKLLAEAFGDTRWRYEPPAARQPARRLAGWKDLPARRFAWPAELQTVDVKQLEPCDE
jgi:hypothetical protein